MVKMGPWFFLINSTSGSIFVFCLQTWEQTEPVLYCLSLLVQSLEKGPACLGGWCPSATALELVGSTILLLPLFGELFSVTRKKEVCDGIESINYTVIHIHNFLPAHCDSLFMMFTLWWNAWVKGNFPLKKYIYIFYLFVVDQPQGCYLIDYHTFVNSPGWFLGCQSCLQLTCNECNQCTKGKVHIARTTVWFCDGIQKLDFLLSASCDIAFQKVQVVSETIFLSV